MAKSRSLPDMDGMTELIYGDPKIYKKDPKQKNKDAPIDELTLKRSFFTYCRDVIGTDDKDTVRQMFDALRAKYYSDLDFHTDIVLAYWVYLQKKV